MADKGRNNRKRKFMRTDIELKVKYRAGKYQSWYSTATKSIGTGGICLFSREYLGMGTIMQVQLFLPDSETTIDLTGFVLWSDFLTDLDLYESGIQLMDVDEDKIELISRLIDRVARPRAVLPQI
jgi:hypothetical protein